jgi:hypothetical protein
MCSRSASVVRCLQDEKEAIWSEACGILGSFCLQACTCVTITFGTMLYFIQLPLISYCLFTAYEAPPPLELSSMGIEIFFCSIKSICIHLVSTK